MKDTLTILTDAYAIIRDKNNWITGFAARNSSGFVVPPWETGAVMFCGAGAIWRASGASMHDSNRSEVNAAFKAMELVLGKEIPYVNDGPDGHARVCAGFEKAIEIEKARVEVTRTAQTITFGAPRQEE